MAWNKYLQPFLSYLSVSCSTSNVILHAITNAIAFTVYNSIQFYTNTMHLVYNRKHVIHSAHPLNVHRMYMFCMQSEHQSFFHAFLSELLGMLQYIAGPCLLWLEHSSNHTWYPIAYITYTNQVHLFISHLCICTASLGMSMCMTCRVQL